ncbi:MAG: hypothetical protein WC302_03380 [Candidatus Paceibacterota bacterium]
MLAPYKEDALIVDEEEPIKDPTALDELWETFDKDLPQLHWDYLEKRGYDPKYLQRKYLVRSCYITGRFPYRVVVPVIMNGQIVNISARDVTGKQKEKYMGLKNNEAIIPMKSCLYNIDSVRDKIVIVEGIFDQWKIGNGCVATFGVEWTSDQLDLIREKDVIKAFVMYDAEEKAQKKAEILANALSAFVPSVEIVVPPKADPGELTKEEAWEIRRELGL